MIKNIKQKLLLSIALLCMVAQEAWADEFVVNLSQLNDNYQVFNDCVLTGTLRKDVMISVANGAHLTLRDATIKMVSNSQEHAGITCEGHATITLEGNNTVLSFENFYPCIEPGPKGSELTIQGDGSLYLDNEQFSAPAIGPSRYRECGDITIDGGTITAYGGVGYAGIGKSTYSCGTITIKGGTISAHGGVFAAGIGGRKDMTGGDIFIYGGKISAYGGEYAAGIGGGKNARGGAIWITGGNIDAYGGTDAAGIGGGESGNSGSIVINGGDVYAKGDGYGVGIGAGEDGDVEYISIKGGTIHAEGGEDIGRAIGGEDDEYFESSRLSIGDDIKVIVPLGQPFGNIPLSFSTRGFQMKDNRKLMFGPCDHDGATYRIEDSKYHLRICQWCGYKTDEHMFDNANHCTVCGYDGLLPTAITLDVTKDMQAMLSDMKDKTVDITFSGRQFIIDSKWNTLCLPFSLSNEQIADSPLAGCTIVELDIESTNLKDGVLTLAYKKATDIKAGMPYLVKWVVGDEEMITKSPLFKSVTVSAVTPTPVTAAGITFTGTFVPLTLTDGNKSSLWLDDHVRLRWANKNEEVLSTWCWWNLNNLDASTLNAIVVTFDDGSRPFVELMDGMTDFSILSAFGEQEVNASLEGRKLSADVQPNGTENSRAYTVCLPFYADLTTPLISMQCDFSIYSKAEITEDGELLFTQEMLPFLYPGNAYLIVVNHGILPLQGDEVTLTAEADEADDDMNSVLLNYENDQIAGYWLGSLKTIGHDEAVSRRAYTMISDGSFQRITNTNPTWYWPAFRSMFCAKPGIIAKVLPTIYKLDANGEEEEDRSLPAPESYQGDNDGEATAIAPVIHTINRDGTERWFDLNGRQLNGKPTKKGVYIHRGKKQVVK